MFILGIQLFTPKHITQSLGKLTECLFNFEASENNYRTSYIKKMNFDSSERLPSKTILLLINELLFEFVDVWLLADDGLFTLKKVKR